MKIINYVLAVFLLISFSACTSVPVNNAIESSSLMELKGKSNKEKWGVAKIEIEKGNYSQVINLLNNLSDSGHVEAQYHLGIAYEKGLGVDLDINRSIKWLESAAHQDHAAAQYKLALIYTKVRFPQ